MESFMELKRSIELVKNGVLGHQWTGTMSACLDKAYDNVNIKDVVVQEVDLSNLKICVEFDTGFEVLLPKGGVVDIDVIRKYATPSPFGLGEYTIFDKEVRDAIEIDAAHLALTGDIKIEGTSIFPYSVHVKLYKLVAYEKGGHFAPHRDTLRASNHVGSAVVLLPSAFEGGELIFFDRDEILTGNYSCKNSATFYTDLVHHVEPVRCGTKVALLYNIYISGEEPARTKVAKVADVAEVSEVSTEILKNTESEEEVESGDESEESEDEIQENMESEAFYRMKDSASTDANFFKPEVKSLNMTLPQNVKTDLWSAVNTFIGKSEYVGILCRHLYSMESMKASALKGIDVHMYDLCTEQCKKVELMNVIITAEYDDDETSTQRCYVQPFTPEIVALMREIVMQKKSTQEYIANLCSERQYVSASSKTRIKKVTEMLPDPSMRVHVPHDCGVEQIDSADYVQYTGNESAMGRFTYLATMFVIRTN